MNTMFALLLFFSLLCIPVFLIWALIKRLRKKSVTKTLIMAMTSSIVFFVSCVGFGFTMEPVVRAESIELSIPDIQPEYDINTEIPVTISVLPENADTSSLDFISSGDTLTFSDSVINTGSEEGTYEISIESRNVKSNTITISVVDVTAREAAQEAEEKAAKEAEEKRLAEERAAKEAEEKRLAEERAAKEAEEKRLAEERAAKEAEEKRLAEERAAKEAEEKRLAEERAAKEAEEKRLAEERAAEEAEEKRLAEERASASTGSGGSGNADNFNTYNNTEQQQTFDPFVLNTSTHKIHYPGCRDVPKIAPQNYSTSSQSLDELKAQGYTTCGHCF